MGELVSYEVLEYLESNGNQYIDTGLPVPSNASFDAAVAVYDAGTSGLMGARSTTSISSASYNLFIINGSVRCDTVGEYNNGLNIAGFALAEPFEIHYTPSKTDINGVSYANVSKADCDKTFYLFNFNNAGAAYSKGTSQRLYWFKMYHGDTLVADLIPVRKNGVCCMYDLCTERFLYNIGSGEFIGGPRVALLKDWLECEYEGQGNGTVVFSSDSYEGIDRRMTVVFKNASESIAVERTVRQEGIRQRFVTSDGKVFCVAEGRFGVLHSSFVPDEPVVETYTRLTYIECTADQYFDSGYVVKETDTIEAYYDAAVESVDKFLYYSTSNQGSVWLSIYSNTGYVRFGQTASKSVSNAAVAHFIKAKKESVTFDVTETALDYKGMPTATLKIFGAINSSGLYNGYKGRCTMIKVSDADGNATMELRPVKRDSDGKVGMLDLIRGDFFISDYEDFIGGNEILIAEGYEIIDRVSCNKDKRFDTGFYGNNTTSIEVMFQRTLTSSAAYLFGCTSGNRLTGYLASNSAYWRYGSAAPTFSIGTLKIYKGVVTPGKTTVDNTSRTFSFSEFTTSYTIPVCGYKASSDTITKTFVGFMYYFRMWHGDTLLLDWYPCKRLSDGVEGFWDCVTQAFVEPV